MREAGLPPEELQASITPMTGAEALAQGHQVADVIHEQVRRHEGSLDTVLDFGCGWGRVIRYFDVPRLWGVDVQERAVEACRETIPFARFTQVETLGPAPFEDETFDLVYAYSVFTHLSERAHLSWLMEFERILRPGGLLMVTTLGRPWIKAAEFPSPVETSAAFDRGEYCFLPTYGEHFGYACIPESYVRNVWSQRFEVLDFFLALTQFWIVCRR